MSGQFDAIMALIDDFRKSVTHQLDEIEVKLDAYGDRITRAEIAVESNAKRIETVECAPAKKRENWKTWLAIIGGILGVAAIVVPALMALARWFESVKATLGVG